MKNKILQIIGGGLLGYGIMLFGFAFTIFSSKFIQYETSYLIAVWMVMIIGFVLGIFQKKYIVVGSSFIFLFSLGFRYSFESLFLNGGNLWIAVILGLFISLLIIGWLFGFSGQWMWKKGKNYFLKKKKIA